MGEKRERREREEREKRERREKREEREKRRERERERRPGERMLFYSFFKTLTGKEVTVELKNDLAITGILHSVDQYLNIKLNEIKVVDESKHPHLMAVKNCFIRGSVVRYIQLPQDKIDTDLLHDATRREARNA